MFNTNRNNRLNIQDLNSGETLFSFLKRKKTANFNPSSLKNETNKSHSEILEKPTFDESQYSSVQIKKENNNSTITPKKVTFI